MDSLTDLLAQSATHHKRVCPRQVLGARTGLLAGLLLDLPLPQPEKRLIAIAETDGCFVDGISAATGCYVGRRTLRIEDYGKTAATFIDSLTEGAVRIAPRQDVRELA
ncbi:MAG: formylmethanofuran dehydrogenase, partial [Chloroflexi bacterium]